MPSVAVIIALVIGAAVIGAAVYGAVMFGGLKLTQKTFEDDDLPVTPDADDHEGLPTDVKF